MIAGAYIFFPGLTVAKRTLQLAILNLAAAGLNLGLNLVLFAITSNYKRDVVHVRTLLDRMRQQGGYE